eukprot:CAMPEP_0203813710 /NCGR_PEP_ID=MMETSP0115-20131106/4873_1 /ASSEMBLY_ACC=CAM_ASM_000227 /TAXON_ID=33651 /ORGANISM="Bicosoecid sp, Strain ms1" /LENGTH=619 /DNA_ID=CAMNT_0050722585 /DNA_START=327 /DNA_END=2183 /DNA_ORIENTATION=+
MAVRVRSGSFPVYSNPDAPVGVQLPPEEVGGLVVGAGEAARALAVGSAPGGALLPIVSPLAVGTGSPMTGFVVGSAPAELAGGLSAWNPVDASMGAGAGAGGAGGGGGGGGGTDDEASRHWALGGAGGGDDGEGDDVGDGGDGGDVDVDEEDDGGYVEPDGTPGRIGAFAGAAGGDDEGDDGGFVVRGRSRSAPQPMAASSRRPRGMSAPGLETIDEDAPSDDALTLDLARGAHSFHSPLSPGQASGSPELNAMLQRAVELYSKALSVKARCDSSVRPLSPGTVRRMSDMFIKSGDASVGQKLLARATGIFSDTLGAGHPSVASALKLSGCLHVQSREYDLAMERFVPAVRICENAFGPSHSVTADVVFNVALLHSYRGAYGDSVACLERVLATYEEIHGADSGPACAVRAKLAVARRAFAQQQYTVRYEAGLEAQSRGDLAAAVGAFEACIEVVPEDPTAAMALAGCFGATGNVDDGLEWLRRAVAWGFADEDALVSDDDLASLRDHPAFWEIVNPHPSSHDGYGEGAYGGGGDGYSDAGDIGEAMPFPAEGFEGGRRPPVSWRRPLTLWWRRGERACDAGRIGGVGGAAGAVQATLSPALPGRLPSRLSTRARRGRG